MDGTFLMRRESVLMKLM